MSDPAESLILDLLEWIGPHPAPLRRGAGGLAQFMSPLDHMGRRE